MYVNTNVELIWQVNWWEIAMHALPNLLELHMAHQLLANAVDGSVYPHERNRMAELDTWIESTAALLEDVFVEGHESEVTRMFVREVFELMLHAIVDSCSDPSFIFSFLLSLVSPNQPNLPPLPSSGRPVFPNGRGTESAVSSQSPSPVPSRSSSRTPSPSRKPTQRPLVAKLFTSPSFSSLETRLATLATTQSKSPTRGRLSVPMDGIVGPRSSSLSPDSKSPHALPSPTTRSETDTFWSILASVVVAKLNGGKWEACVLSDWYDCMAVVFSRNRTFPAVAVLYRIMDVASGVTNGVVERYWDIWTSEIHREHVVRAFRNAVFPNGQFVRNSMSASQVLHIKRELLKRLTITAIIEEDVRELLHAFDNSEHNKRLICAFISLMTDWLTSANK